MSCSSLWPGRDTPGMTGTPDSATWFFERILSPIMFRACTPGPMKTMPASPQAPASAWCGGACGEAGIVFIGPGVHALNMMGDKIRSKNHVAESGVPVIPGVSLPGQSDEQLIAASAGVGYPRLIKLSLIH